MILLKKIFKRKHIIAQSVCNHPKLEYYYQANNPKRKNGTLKEKLFTTFIVYVNVINVENLFLRTKLLIT